MKQRAWFSSGITLVEILLVVGIVSVIAATSTPFVSRFLIQNNEQTTRETLISFLRKAQLNSVSGKDDTIWGICLSGSSVVLYSDSCGTPGQSSSFQISPSITITGLSDISFSRNRGEPSAAATITITSSVGSKSVVVSEIGGIE